MCRRVRLTVRLGIELFLEVAIDSHLTQTHAREARKHAADEMQEGGLRDDMKLCAAICVCSLDEVPVPVEYDKAMDM